MSAFSGPQSKGAMRRRREVKREAAQFRQALSRVLTTTITGRRIASRDTGPARHA